jgi:hypothetical protein
MTSVGNCIAGNISHCDLLSHHAGAVKFGGQGQAILTLAQGSFIMYWCCNLILHLIQCLFDIQSDQ